MNLIASRGSLLPALGLGLALSASAHAQTTLYTVNGINENDRLGAAVGSAGDYNDDGFKDFVVGAPEDFNVFAPAPGFVRVYSGLTGNVLTTIPGDNNWDGFGSAVDGAGDFNDDGWDDIVVGAPVASILAPQAGQIKVISGADDSELLVVNGAATLDNLGRSVSGAGDVNNDGYDDVIVGAPNVDFTFSNQGEARVYSGIDGALLWSFAGSANNKRRGYSVSELGDVNGDNHDDVIVGSLFDGVRVYSGLTGLTIHNFPNTPANNDDAYGRTVASVDDVNGDGVRDILIGATQESPLAPGNGYVQCRSGLTGQLLWTTSGDNLADRFGYSVSGLGDWDGDGTPDVAVGANPNNAAIQSYVRILSGTNGNVLATLNGTLPGDDLGFAVAGLGDVNGDGKTNLIAGAPLAETNGLAAGYARVYEGAAVGCGGATNYCVTSPNSAGPGALIGISGSTSIANNDLVLVATGCPASQNGVFYFGPNQVQMPFGDGFRCVGGTVIRLPVVNTGVSGVAAFPVNYNMGGGTVIDPNETWNFQFWYRDPSFGVAGFNLSNAISISFCP